ncbi:MAG: hypothetical protein AABZ30_13000 [Myxococcota bacterium]
MFLYEGAAALGFADQKPHANPVKGTTVEQEGARCWDERARNLTRTT